MDNELQDLRKYSFEQFDKLIVQLAAGGLGLTMAFIEKIVKVTADTDYTYVKITWICFATSLLMSLLSHLTARLSIDETIKNGDNSGSIYNGITSALNWLSVLSVVTGILLFILFTFNNL